MFGWMTYGANGDPSDDVLRGALFVILERGDEVGDTISREVARFVQQRARYLDQIEHVRANTPRFSPEYGAVVERWAALRRLVNERDLMIISLARQVRREPSLRNEAFVKVRLQLAWYEEQLGDSAHRDPEHETDVWGQPIAMQFAGRPKDSPQLHAAKVSARQQEILRVLAAVAAAAKVTGVSASTLAKLLRYRKHDILTDLKALEKGNHVQNAGTPQRPKWRIGSGKS